MVKSPFLYLVMLSCKQIKLQPLLVFSSCTVDIKFLLSSLFFKDNRSYIYILDKYCFYHHYLLLHYLSLIISCFPNYQAAMSKVEDGAEQEDLLYDQFSEKDELWFDFMADTGDGGNSSYSVAKLLAQPSIKVWSNDSLLTLPRGNLLLIGGDLA